MAMLSDRDLYTLAVDEEVVTPFVAENCEGASIDLTLDKQIKKYISDQPIALGKAISDDDYEGIDISNKEYYIHPNESVLIQTREFIKVPDNLSARIYERYSVKSLGLNISPAHYLNPGYRGTVSLLAVNNSAVPIKMVPGIKICQLSVFELTSMPLKPYAKQDAKYMDSKEVSISKLHLDREIQEFLKLKGVQNITDEMTKELGDFLQNKVSASAKKLADILRNKEGHYDARQT